MLKPQDPQHGFLRLQAVALPQAREALRRGRQPTCLGRLRLGHILRIALAWNLSLGDVVLVNFLIRLVGTRVLLYARLSQALEMP